MIKDADDIRDDEIRILSDKFRFEKFSEKACCDSLDENTYNLCTADDREAPKPSRKSRSDGFWTTMILGVLLVLAIVAIVAILTISNKTPEVADVSYFENESVYNLCIEHHLTEERRRLGRMVDKDIGGFCEKKDTIINDILFNIFIPHNATMSLIVGPIDRNNKDIVYAAQAADVRADNGDIVGAFVLEGEPLAWGLSKKGYCASINGVVSIGVADNSPLFEEATEKGGYFFRQYPLVKDGRPMHNDLRGKSIRRAICDRNGEIFMVATSTPESFHDFIQALVDLRVDQAVYLVGSTAIGWAVEEDGTRYEWGDHCADLRRRKMPKNTSYIVWEKQ